MIEQAQIYPSDETLIQTYQDIGETALGFINSGRAIGNPILRGEILDTRWSIACEGLINGSPASLFLQQAIDEIKNVEPTMRFLPKTLLHLTLGEIAFNAEGRPKSGVDGAQAKKYYQALRNFFPQDLGSIKLNLHKIIAAADTPQAEQSPITIVGSFLTEGDNKVFHAREQLAEAIARASLHMSSRLGMIRVLFISLGRLVNPPQLRDGQAPLVEVIDNLNERLHRPCQAEINGIDLISTTRISYPYPDGHVFFWPPISFNRGRQNPSNMRFLTAHMRVGLLNNCTK